MLPSQRWVGGMHTTWLIMVFFIAPPPQPSPIRKGEGVLLLTVQNWRDSWDGRSGLRSYTRLCDPSGLAPLVKEIG
jgi:hypothetical protein